MNQLHNIAQLLVASCKLSGMDRVPTSHGLLHRALKSAFDAGAFPNWAREELHFVDSRVGLQCVELSQILEWAQDAQFTSAPNPSYQYTDIQISKKAAQQLLYRIGTSEEDACKLGGRISETLREFMSNPEDQLDEPEDS